MTGKLEILTPPVPGRGRSFCGDVDRHHQQFGFLATQPWGDFAVVQLFNTADHPQALQLTRRGLEALGDRFHVWSSWDEEYLGAAGPACGPSASPTASAAKPGLSVSGWRRKPPLQVLGFRLVWPGCQPYHV
jgi:hypothetical protein